MRDKSQVIEDIFTLAVTNRPIPPKTTNPSIQCAKRNLFGPVRDPSKKGHEL